MILLCQTCGWRINERYNIYKIENNENNEDIGKYLLYNHKPFCSIECINKAKQYPKILNREVIPSDWEEQGYINKNRPNDIENWKTERKINRIRKKNNI